MSTYRLGIAVVAYRSEETLPDCLASIRRWSPDAFVVVVENSGDLDGVGAIARSTAPLDVEVVDSGGNVGYAKGVNLAAAKIMTRQCTHLLILNPDVLLTADPLDLLPYLERADVVAGVLSACEAPANGSRLHKLEASNAKREITWRSSLIQAVIGTRFNRVGPVQGGEPTLVPQVDGAYMLQTVAYYRVHMLDEQFELYFEDVEYCDRARMGRGVVLVGVRVGVHMAGASAAKSSGCAYMVNRVSRARYLRRKYQEWPRWVIAAPFAIEFLVRSATQQDESTDTRWQAYALAMQELRMPGSVRVLEGAPAATPGGPG